MKKNVVYKIIFFGFLIITSGCGIYTTQGALNPPFNISINQQTLKFSGNNTEDNFEGYILWYKENENDEYSIIVFKGELLEPTIPEYSDLIDPLQQWLALQGELWDDSAFPQIDFTVEIKDMEHFEKGKSFDELYIEEGSHFYFAVSAFGINEAESEKVEFGIWPST